MTLALAKTAAGGPAALARLIGISRQALWRWTQVPADRLWQVADATGVAPEQLRPDLVDEILEERRRRRMAVARERHSLIAAAVPRTGGAVSPEDQETLDILATLAAARFVAAERNLALAAVLLGREREAAGARAWAMALALVVARGRATTIGGFFGTSRQNVDNAAERYMRARDGDDPDDFLDAGLSGGRVIERGRIRKAKAADGAWWEAERRFAAVIGGGR